MIGKKYSPLSRVPQVENGFFRCIRSQTESRSSPSGFFGTGQNSRFHQLWTVALALKQQHVPTSSQNLHHVCQLMFLLCVCVWNEIHYVHQLFSPCNTLMKAISAESNSDLLHADLICRSLDIPEGPVVTSEVRNFHTLATSGKSQQCSKFSPFGVSKP